METMFWTRLKQLCAEHNTTPTGVCKAVGLSTGSPPAWKRGSIPNPAARKKLAEFFGVDPDYFINETEKAPAEKPAGATENEIRYALFNGDVISDDGWQMVLDFVEMVKEREKKKKTKEE